MVPPSGGSLEIGNFRGVSRYDPNFGEVPPSGGSLEIGNLKEVASQPRPPQESSPFGGIPRNWKHWDKKLDYDVPLSAFPLRGDP